MLLCFHPCIVLYFFCRGTPAWIQFLYKNFTLGMKRVAPHTCTDKCIMYTHSSTTAWDFILLGIYVLYSIDWRSVTYLFISRMLQCKPWIVKPDPGTPFEMTVWINTKNCVTYPYMYMYMRGSRNTNCSIICLYQSYAGNIKTKCMSPTLLVSHLNEHDCSGVLKKVTLVGLPIDSMSVSFSLFLTLYKRDLWFPLGLRSSSKRKT